VQQEDSIDEKLQKMKEELLSFLQQSHPTAISTSQPVLPVIDPNAFQE
jgi:flagellar motor switch protein FliG